MVMTTIGFFSIVQKPEDRHKNTLTIRARVKSDLEALRQGYLPDMGEILDHLGTDYRYRAVAPQTSVANALSRLTLEVDYDNFKDEVQRMQGDERARAYSEVWCALYRLQD